jgi:hypothetical protein
LGLQKRVRAAQARRQREFEAVLFHKKKNKKLLRETVERRNTILAEDEKFGDKVP